MECLLPNILICFQPSNIRETPKVSPHTHNSQGSLHKVAWMASHRIPDSPHRHLKPGEAQPLPSLPVSILCSTLSAEWPAYNSPGLPEPEVRNSSTFLYNPVLKAYEPNHRVITPRTPLLCTNCWHPPLFSEATLQEERFILRSWFRVIESTMVGGTAARAAPCSIGMWSTSSSHGGRSRSWKNDTRDRENGARSRTWLSLRGQETVREARGNKAGQKNFTS